MGQSLGFFIQDTGQRKKIGCRSQEKTYKHLGIYAEYTCKSNRNLENHKKSEHTSILANQAPAPNSTLPLPTTGDVKTLVCGISIIFVTCCRQLPRGVVNILTAVQ